MRLRRHRIPLSLIVACLVSLSSARTDTTESLADLSPGRRTLYDDAAADLLSTATEVLESRATLNAKDESRLSTSHIKPVDGKDGRPHEGPFIETAAERDRKLAKEAGELDEELPGTAKKPGPKDPLDTDGLPRGPLPKSNDGVMDDPARVGPKEGTRGTEGGISEKSRQRQGSLGTDAVEKTPEEPKQAPPLPHSEQEKLSPAEAEDYAQTKSSKADPTKSSAKGQVEDDDTDDDNNNKDEGSTSELGGLSKPDDLPDKPHDIPHPAPNGASKEDPLEVKRPYSTYLPTEVSPGLVQPLHSFVLSFTMIIFSEIGDKTFLVAALMAMKHPPLFIFSAAFPALMVMTVLSAIFGHAVPQLLPVTLTHWLAAILFLVFGAKMLREGWAISPDEGVGEEMREVEMELEEKEQKARKLEGGRRQSSIDPYVLESGRGGGAALGGRSKRSNSRLPTHDTPPSSPDSRSPSPSGGNGSGVAGGGSGSGGRGRGRGTAGGVVQGFTNLCSLLISPAWVQTFAMTFLGEWGDRSQIATIAMAAGSDYWWVTLGALFGHAACTAVAVVGGRAIAGRVSMRVVTLGGAYAFIFFGLVYLAEALFYH